MANITFSSKSLTRNKEITTAFAKQFLLTGLSGGDFLGSVRLIIRHPTSPLVLFNKLFRTAAILLPLNRMLYVSFHMIYYKFL